MISVQIDAVHSAGLPAASNVTVVTDSLESGHVTIVIQVEGKLYSIKVNKKELAAAVFALS